MEIEPLIRIWWLSAIRVQCPTIEDLTLFVEDRICLFEMAIMIFSYVLWARHPCHSFFVIGTRGVRFNMYQLKSRIFFIDSYFRGCNCLKIVELQILRCGRWLRLSRRSQFQHPSSLGSKSWLSFHTRVTKHDNPTRNSTERFPNKPTQRMRQKWHSLKKGAPDV